MTIIGVLGVWFGIYAIFWVFTKIGEYFDSRRRKIRDQVYHELVKGDVINQEVSIYRKKLSNIGYLEPDTTKQIIQSYFRNVPKYHFIREKCPECENGYLSIKKGKHGKFFGCSNYPNCRKTANLKDLQSQIKQRGAEEFLQDFIRAYS